MNTLTTWNGMTHLRRELDRLLDRAWEGSEMPEIPVFGDWHPAIDLKETKDAVVVHAEVAGMAPNDIHIGIREGMLIIEGEKKQEKEEKDEKKYRMERVYGSFSRSIRLPVTVDASKVSATFKNGVIEVTMPKALAARETTIPIKAA